MGQIDGYFVDCETLRTPKEVFHQAHVAKQSNHIRPSSPYRVSFLQIKYLVGRNFKRLKGDPSLAILGSVDK